MCVTPKTPKMDYKVVQPNATPEKAPDPVAISSDQRDKKRSGRNSLRIDLASGAPKSGVNV